MRFKSLAAAMALGLVAFFVTPIAGPPSLTSEATAQTPKASQKAKPKAKAKKVVKNSKKAKKVAKAKAAKKQASCGTNMYRKGGKGKCLDARNKK